jgi:hypothetical protein
LQTAFTLFFIPLTIAHALDTCTHVAKRELHSAVAITPRWCRLWSQI